MYPFHQQVQEFFPQFDYMNPSPDVRRRCNMSLGQENVVGHQQRAFACYWAIKQCSAVDLGLDIGSSKGLTPYCISVDMHGHGGVHPFYGGGAYFSDTVIDGANLAGLTIFPTGGVPLVMSNHSLEHMPCSGDEGVVNVLSGWIGKLRQGGVLAMIIPDNDHFDVMGSDKDHKHAWGASNFEGRVLNKIIAQGQVELAYYNTLSNKFSFDVVLKRK